MTLPCASSRLLPVLVLLSACGGEGRAKMNAWNELSAVVRWRTSSPSTSYVRFGHDDQRWQLGSDALEKKHEVVVYGLRPHTDYTLELVSETKGGRESVQELDFRSGGTPRLAKRFDLSVDERDLVQPGWTLFNLQEPEEKSLAVIYDLDGYPVWYYELDKVDEGVIDASITPRGSVMIGGTPPPGKNAVEVTFEGEELWKGPKQVGDGETGYLHHHTERLANGHVLMLEKLRDGALGDVAFEVNADGDRVWEWTPFDWFDAPASGDWTHTNWIHREGGSAYVSMAAMHQVVKFDIGSGEVEWVLGDGGDFDLVGDTRWFRFQHAPHVQPNGNILVYDNRGAGGHTRVIEYELDTEAWTATVVWEYAGGRDNQWDAPFMGSVYPLDNGNLIICAGGDRGDRRIFEITEDGRLVWQMHTGKAYRARRIAIPLEPVPVD